MTTFWILWIFNALMALVPIYFFFVGLADGSISSRNIGMWFLILLAVAVVLGGSYLLKGHQMAIAKTLLIIAAIPGIIALLYLLIIVVGKPDFR